jgi:hypothetical protein
MTRYLALRTWSTFLITLGVLGMIVAGAGVISGAVAADGFWETMAVVFLGGPIVLLLAAWPIALGQALRAIADIGDAVAPGPMGSAGSVPRIA